MFGAQVPRGSYIQKRERQATTITGPTVMVHRIQANHADCCKAATEDSPGLLSEISKEVNANLKLVSDTLENLAKTADQTAELLSGEEQKQIEEYLERTSELHEQSLRGEAKRAIRQYAVTEENYTAAVEILQAKFGDKSKLIYDLQVRLERASATSIYISSEGY
uniref:SB domain-containing protein n=1 Tax=Haemonchus contortus TaxID=6289 RepID=A0A7I4Y672_HAECO